MDLKIKGKKFCLKKKKGGFQASVLLTLWLCNHSYNYS